MLKCFKDDKALYKLKMLELFLLHGDYFYLVDNG